MVAHLSNFDLPLYIGWRYTASKKRSNMVSFISLISMAGLAIGVSLLIVVLSVMNGFDREMKERILGLVPQASINSYDPMEDWQAIAAIAQRNPRVVATAPFIHVQGMLLKRGIVEPALVQGISPEHEKKVSVLANYLSGISIEELSPGEIVLGEELAKSMGASIGDSINFILPQAGSSGQLVPKIARFSVVGVFDSGTEVDRKLAYVHIDSAAELVGMNNQVQGVRLKIDDLFQAASVATQVLYSLPYGYYSRDWTSTHGNLFEAIQLSKKLVVLLLFIVVAVAAFNVVSTLFLVVSDKSADIAILRTLGISPGRIMAIFMVQGTVIGIVGTLIGAALGVLFSLCVSDFVVFVETLFSIQFLRSDVYPVNHLPADLRVADIAIVCVLAIAMSFVATLYPSWRATKVQPAEALRYE